jgi:hypothetical protein
MNNEVNLFILIPEETPKFDWINDLNTLIDEENAISFIQNLELFIKSTNLEAYNGFYDNDVFLELVRHIEVIDDCFPNPIKKRLINLFRTNFINWRENRMNTNNDVYQIFNQAIENHALCEIVQRRHVLTEGNYALFNNFAIKLANQLEITVNLSEIYLFKILSCKEQLTEWFSENRIPKRKFQAIPKHNIQHPIVVNNRVISPLYGSTIDPEEILKTAIGIDKKELFGYDSGVDKYIVFKYENVEHQNQYHGYHIALDSDEIPAIIKQKLQQ